MNQNVVEALNTPACNMPTISIFGKIWKIKSYISNYIFESDISCSEIHAGIIQTDI